MKNLKNLSKISAFIALVTLSATVVVSVAAPTIVHAASSSLVSIIDEVSGRSARVDSNGHLFSRGPEATEPFQRMIGVETDSGTGVLSAMIVTVPPGKRLVLSHFSGSLESTCSTDAASGLRPWLSTTLHPSIDRVDVLATTEYQQPWPEYRVHGWSGPIHAVAGENTYVYAYASMAGGDRCNWSGTVTVTGYFIDVPTEPAEKTAP